MQRLGSYGESIVKPLVAEMRVRAHDPEYCTRAGMALKALGPRRARSLADALDTIEEPLPLQVVVEVIGALGEKSMIYRLKDLIDRIALRTPWDGPPGGVDPYQRVRAKAHLELARIGSRVAIQDLRDALSDAGQRVELELLGAVELVGKREELGVLLAAYKREESYVQRQISDVVREIMTRERIRRNTKLLLDLTEEQRDLLERILAGAPKRASRRRGRARQARL